LVVRRRFSRHAGRTLIACLATIAISSAAALSVGTGACSGCGASRKI
jgi:hypothetical protein